MSISYGPNGILVANNIIVKNVHSQLQPPTSLHLHNGTGGLGFRVTRKCTGTRVERKVQLADTARPDGTLLT